MPPLHFEILTNADELKSIAGAWATLVNESACNRACSSPAWSIEAARLPVASPYVIVGWRMERLAAVLPLAYNAETGDAAALCPEADYNDVICREGDESAAAECLAFAVSPTKPYLRLNLRRVRLDSNCLNAIRQSGRDLEAFYRQEGGYSHTLLPATFDQYLASKSKNFRSLIRRAQRAAHNDGALIRELQPSQNVAADIPELLFRLNRHRLGEASVFRGNSRIRSFVQDAFPTLFMEGRLRIFVVEYQGRVEAIDIATVGHNSLCTWNAGFSDMAARWSPGWLLSAFGIRRAIELGCQEYDLLRGSQGWKGRLANRHRDVGRLTIPVGAFRC